MGSRLGVLLKTYSGWEIYYNHSAAQTVGLDIAIDGMEATYERVRRMSPMGVDDPHAWKGATWIEGTLLIDETRKLVVWAEESEALYMPRLINYLVEHTWPGGRPPGQPKEPVELFGLRASIRPPSSHTVLIVCRVIARPV